MKFLTRRKDSSQEIALPSVVPCGELEWAYEVLEGNARGRTKVPVKREDSFFLGRLRPAVFDYRGQKPGKRVSDWGPLGYAYFHVPEPMIIKFLFSLDEGGTGGTLELTAHEDSKFAAICYCDADDRIIFYTNMGLYLTSGATLTLTWNPEWDILGEMTEAGAPHGAG